MKNMDQQTGKWFNILRRADNVNRWAGQLTLYLVFLLPAVMLYEVILRYVFNSPTVWVFETSNFIFGAIIILGGGYLLLHKGHVSVDILYSRLSVRARAILDLCTSPLYFLFIGVLMWQGIDMFWTSMMRWENSPSVWSPPLWPVKFLIPLGCSLMLLQLVIKFIKDIITARYHKEVVAIKEERYYG